MKIPKTLTHTQITALTGAVCLGTGAAIGYFIGRRQRKLYTIPAMEPEEYLTYLDTRLVDLENMEDLIDKNEYRESDEDTVVTISEEKPEPDGIDVESFIQDKLRGVVISPEEEVEVSLEGVQHNTFAGDDEDWDWGQEVLAREGREIYVLHRDEFYADEREYTQTTLTYYSGDDFLVDQEDVPIMNPVNIIGEYRFGQGSQDKNVFYVRNEKLGSEFEILFDDGMYAVQVLGIEAEHQAEANELKHSVRRFRQE